MDKSKLSYARLSADDVCHVCHMQGEKCGFTLQDDRHCVQGASQHKPGGLNNGLLYYGLFKVKDEMKLLMTLLLILFVLHHPDFQACVDQRRTIRFHHRLLQPGVYAKVED